MNAEDISLRVVEILNAHQIAYMLVGSLSTNFHAIVRSTKDADIVIQTNLGDVGRLVAREFELLELDPQFGFESVTVTKKRSCALEKARALSSSYLDSATIPTISNDSSAEFASIGWADPFGSHRPRTPS